MEIENVAFKLGRFRFIFFPHDKNFGFFKSKFKHGTWFLDVWRFRIWHDGRFS